MVLDNFWLVGRACDEAVGPRFFPFAHPLTIQRRNKTGPPILSGMCAALGVLVALRIIRVWNQTGQKHAGESDIAKSFLPAHNLMLWLIVLATYLDVIWRLSRAAVPWASRHLSTAASFALGVAGIGFKVAFTKSDAPELLEGLEFFITRPMKEASLIAQARAFFISNAILAGLTVLPVVYQRFFEGKTAQGVQAAF